MNDAFLFLRTYSQLSDGQKYRYRIAKLIESGKQWWLMDEFAACLDRDTAKIIAFNLQKIARQQGKAVIAATTHSDLQEDLKPSVLIRKRFGEEGTREDWKKLSSFHYRGHGVSVPRKIFSMVRKDELCGVIGLHLPTTSLLWTTTCTATNDHAGNQSATKHNQSHSHPPKIPNNRLRR